MSQLKWTRKVKNCKVKNQLKQKKQDLKKTICQLMAVIIKWIAMHIAYQIDILKGLPIK